MALLTIGVFVGCSQPAPSVIDGTSADAFGRTAEAARRDLPVADRLDFDRAIATVPARRYGNRDPSASRAAFDGMTAADVVAIERERTKGRMR